MDKDDQKLAQLNLLGGMAIGVEAYSKETYMRLGSLSRWFLGGALVLSYGIITDPKNLMTIYGSLFVKMLLLSFLISAFFGFRFIMGHHLHEVMTSTKSLDSFFEMNELLKKGDIAHQNETEEFDENKVAEMATEKSVHIAGIYLKASKFFWYQLLFIVPPFVAILWKVFLKVSV